MVGTGHPQLLPGYAKIEILEKEVLYDKLLPKKKRKFTAGAEAEL